MDLVGRSQPLGRWREPISRRDYSLDHHIDDDHDGDDDVDEHAYFKVIF